ncbi:MAG: hypothetical protein LC672_02850, partial [Acidobacteria bacterium]|nr:hypothetical protein [Acidobacteriota bacterium]
MLGKLLCTLLIIFMLLPAGLSYLPPAAAFERSHLHNGNARVTSAVSAHVSDKKRSRPLWPGSRFTEADRARAVRRGLNFIYRTALVGRNFDEYGQDYLWCFYTLSVAVRDPWVRSAARRMGLERARFWRQKHASVPEDADAATVSELAYGNDAAESLGMGNAVFKEQLKRAARYFK